MKSLSEDDILSLSSEIHSELDEALELLSKNLNKVEGELDLECANLKDLVNSRNPAIQEQIDALGRSLKDLHVSLANVRGKIQVAHEDSSDLRNATKQVLPDRDQEIQRAPSAEEILSPQEAGRIRHDEKITLGGIFRALFMAEEPAQRFVNPPKD